MARPAEFLDWTDGAPTKVVDPPGSKKLQGWEVESPPFQYMNWLFYQTDLWLKYLDGVVGGSAVSIAADANILTTTGTIAIGSYKMTILASITNLFDGMLIQATGVPSDTYVVSHDATSCVMSKAATANLALNPVIFKHGQATLLNIQRQLDQIDAYIDFITTPVVLGTTGDTTNNSDQLINLASTIGIRIGQLVVGFVGVPANTYVMDLTGSTVTMSKKATATNAGIEVDFIHGYAQTQGKTSVDQLDSQVYQNMGPATQGKSALTSTTTLDGSYIGQTITVDSTAAAFSLNLLRPLSLKNKIIVIQDIGGVLSSNPLTLVRFASEKIGLIAANYVLRGNYGTWYLWSDGTDFFLI